MEPSYLVRFSLVQVGEGGRCDGGGGGGGRPIDRKVLIAVSRIFSYMASIPSSQGHPKPHSAFSGNVFSQQGSRRTPLYLFRLYDTGLSVATPEKRTGIASSHLAALNHGRGIILGQTTSEDLLLFLGNSGAYFYYTINRPGDARTRRRNAYLLPVSGSRLWTINTPLDAIRDTLEFERFAANVLRPPFEAWRPIPAGNERVVVVDYACSGATLAGFREMLRLKNIWSGELYLINIESPRDGYGPPRPVPNYRKLDPIRITMGGELIILTDGGLGRITPPYPWPYWDVPPEVVQYPEKADAPRLIEVIRRNWPVADSGLAEGEGGNVTLNLTGLPRVDSIWSGNSTSHNVSLGNLESSCGAPGDHSDGLASKFFLSIPRWTLSAADACLGKQTDFNSSYTVMQAGTTSVAGTGPSAIAAS